jgi:hypothetical protein
LFSEEFWKGTIGNDTIKLTLAANYLTIDYFPKIYVCEEYTDKGYDYLTDSYIDIVKTRQASQAMYNDYVSRLIDGIKQWAQQNVMIQGVPLDISVNVTPTQVNKKSEADLVVLAHNYTAGSQVRTTLIPPWSPSVKPHMSLGDVEYPTFTDNGIVYDMFTIYASHEFGHVLGLFDAYGYGNHFLGGDLIFPPAPSTIEGVSIPKDDIMRSAWQTPPKYYPIEYEMILYAWSLGTLQYYNPPLLGELSQAFYH